MYHIYAIVQNIVSNIVLYQVNICKTDKVIISALIIKVFKKTSSKTSCVSEIKGLIGFKADSLMFQVHCSSCYHHSSDTSGKKMSGWRLLYVHCGEACYGFSHIIMSSPVVIFFWDTTLP